MGGEKTWVNDKYSLQVMGRVSCVSAGSVFTAGKIKSQKKNKTFFDQSSDTLLDLFAYVTFPTLVARLSGLVNYCTLIQHDSWLVTSVHFRLSQEPCLATAGEAQHLIKAFK